jgi:hypothetical protein
MRAHPNTADVEPRADASPPDLKASMPGRPARGLDRPMSMFAQRARPRQKSELQGHFGGAVKASAR